jgi:filamentous hemagglutinin
MTLREIVSRIIIDSRKLTDYALNLENPVGRDKAVMFHRHLGFTQDNYELLLVQISEQERQQEVLEFARSLYQR